MSKVQEYPTYSDVRITCNSKTLAIKGWALDLIGLINPPSSKGHKFILVVVDYFTKCVEAIPLKVVTHGKIIEFIEKHIIHGFGILQNLATNQGAMFTGQKVINYANS